MSERRGHDALGVDNLPYGSGVDRDGRRRAVVRIGNHGLCLTTATQLLAPEYADFFAAGTLDPFLAAGRATWSAVRRRIVSWLTQDRDLLGPALIPLTEMTMLLPFTVADYADFYASEHHATNVGRIFRPEQPPLRPNWKHLPIGYHGRSGTVVVSRTEVRRPSGLIKDTSGEVIFGPSRRLDIEAEVGFVVGAASQPGMPVSVADFDEHVFGVVLLNDWSARDIQAFEYVPLGPFLGKSFATSISAWITPLEALSAARVAPPPRDRVPAAYLDDSGASYGLDLELEVELNGQVISRPRFADMYWTGAQMLAHLTVNGAHVRTGDLYGSGTVSGPERSKCGSLLELTWGGSEPMRLGDGTTRSFLADGDEVVLRATAPGPRGRIALAEVGGTIVG